MLSQAAGKCGIMAAMLFLCEAASDEMVEDEQPDLPYPAPFSCLPTEQVQAPVVAPSKQLYPPRTWKRDLKKRKSNIEIKSNEVPHVASKEVPQHVGPDVGKSNLVPHVSEIESLFGTDLEKALEVEMEALEVEMELKEEIMPESNEEVPVEIPQPEVEMEALELKEEIMPESNEEVPVIQKPEVEMEALELKEEIMPESNEEVPVTPKPEVEMEALELKEEIMPESKEEVPVEIPKPKEKAPSLPAIQDKPKLKRLRSKQHDGAFEAPSAKARAVRGSAGTFAGRRPPKDPILKATFESIRDTFPDERIEAKEKYGITLSQDNYWFHMQKALKANDGNFDLASDEFKKHLAVEYSRADES